MNSIYIGIAYLILKFIWKSMQNNNTDNEINTVTAHHSVNTHTTQLQAVKYYSTNYHVRGLSKTPTLSNPLDIAYYKQGQNQIPDLKYNFYIVNNITISTTFRAYYQKLLALDNADEINPKIVREAYKNQRKVIYQLKEEGVLIENYLKDLDAAKEYMVYLCAYVGNKN